MKWILRTAFGCLLKSRILERNVPTQPGLDHPQVRCRPLSRLFVAALLLALFLAGCRTGPDTPPAAAVTSFAPVAGLPTATPSPVPPTPFIFFPPIVTPTATPTPPGRTVPAAPRGIWISAEELALLPMSGEAWQAVLDTAVGELDEPNIAGYTSYHDVQTLAVALVYARTGNPAYRAKAAGAIRNVMGTEYTGLPREDSTSAGALAATAGRNLASYVFAADLIDLAGYDPALDETFRTWITGLLHVEWADGSIAGADRARANNHGRMAGASRAAVAAYLGDEAEMAEIARVFKGFLGDRQMYADFKFNRDLSWQVAPEAPVGINPRGAVRDGFAIGGALTEEMRRGCSLQFPPCPTNYPWEALQGILVEAVVLHRQGYDVWNWEDQAILRAVQFLYDLHLAYPDGQWWAAGDDLWIPWLVNAVYGADFPTEPARRGKNMGWTDWTHAPQTALAPSPPAETPPPPAETPLPPPAATALPPKETPTPSGGTP